MAATFGNGLATVGSTETTLYTAPAGLSGLHLVVGFIATNIFGSALPITVKLVRGSDTIYLAHDRRVLPNDTIDILMGTKITLIDGDLIKVKAPLDNAFSVFLTVTEEVLT
jgi:hypothetical protein